MKLPENLSVNQYGIVNGLVDLGQFSTGSANSVMADHALVVIFQPFTWKWHQVLGVFASKGNVKANLLAKIILECIILAEKSGLFVDFVTTDAASWNRSIWRIFGIRGKLERVVCKTSHPADSKRQLHFVSDFPHLVKNVRNSFLHHPFATPEGTATVKHIEVAWEYDQQGSISLKSMPKIHRSVVKPDGFEKMRVSYAFRIFSDEVRRGLFMYKEQIEWRHGSINATESFVRLMKDVIEIMTSRFPAAALRLSSRKADRLAEFLEYLNEWERSAENGGFISASTAEGLRVTLSSTLSLLQYATTKLGFRYIMTSRLSQHILEQLFGILRQMSGTNDHPTPVQFLLSINTLEFMNLSKSSASGNVPSGLLSSLLNGINKDRFSITCYRALPAAMDQLEEEWRPPTLDDPWRLQLWPYRPHSPIVWFAQVDAQLYVNGVSSHFWRYLLLKREIPTDVFSCLDLPSSDQNMYEGLKTAFFQHFGVPVPDHLRSTTQFPSTADASEGMAQTTSSSSPSALGERCATARESCAAPTPQEPLCGDKKTTAPPASCSFPDDEQPPAALPAPSTTQLVSPLVLSNDHLASTPEHTKESACTPSPPELHGVPSPSRGDDSAASRALTAVETPISPPVPSEILRHHCGETGPPAITCTELPSYASVFLVEPLSHVSSRSARSVSRLQRPNHTALTFGHKDASPACCARRRRTRAQRGRQPRCFAGFRRCVHPILHKCQGGRCYRALRKRPPSTPSLCSRVRLTFTPSAGAGFDVAVGADAPHHRLHHLTSPNLDDVIVAAAFPAPFCGRPSMLTDHTSASAA
ncbi:hypothetical protein HPB49_013397 [Dermacentor silvarum]|uniref:Uncharacterized protein n=1 Tax=Dermacentor silvarum TaxID=543639 RepID=A0ACB8C9Q2_DERSI|nr:hypothetical protein HPB49_013397 [Dermacentor silvarum]